MTAVERVEPGAKSDENYCWQWREVAPPWRCSLWSAATTATSPNFTDAIPNFLGKFWGGNRRGVWYQRRRWDSLARGWVSRGVDRPTARSSTSGPLDTRKPIIALGPPYLRGRMVLFIEPTVSRRYPFRALLHFIAPDVHLFLKIFIRNGGGLLRAG